MDTYVFSYSSAATSGKNLADKIGAKFIHRSSDLSATPDRASTLIIGWGRGTSFNAGQRTVLNTPTAICRAIDKITAFNAFTRTRDVVHPAFTTFRGIAQGWSDAGHRVYARTTTSGHDGEGLVVIEPGGTVPSAPLYTRGLADVANEYRVTVFGTAAVCTQRKVPVSSRDPSTINQLVRTTNGGWGFDVVNHMPSVSQMAVNAVRALGLDFGGVDLAVAGGLNTPYVLEVNTAPALTPYCCSQLAQAIIARRNEIAELLADETAHDEEDPFEIPSDEIATYRDTIT